MSSATPTTAMLSNPLVSFRVPKEAYAKFGGTHFATDRFEVVNDTGMLSIYPGDFTYVSDPTLEVDIALWEDSSNMRSKHSFMKMTQRDHFNVMDPKEWVVSDRLANVWKDDGQGRLTFNGDKTLTMVLMWRTGQAFDECFERSLKWSNDITKVAEDSENTMADKLAKLGNVGVNVSVEDDDGTDKVARPKHLTKKGR